MKCPYCFSEESKVIDKRAVATENKYRRRRECSSCNKRYTTYEQIRDINMVVIKKDGRREPFIREKIKNGVIKACEKRPISNVQIERVVSEIENKLRMHKSNEIKSGVIGEMVIKKLKLLDKVAYLRFTSVYKSFGNAKDFERELKNLK